MSYQNRFVRTTIISRFSVICKDLIRFTYGLHFRHSCTFCTPHFLYINSNKSTAGRTKAIHRRLELSRNLYLLLLFWVKTEFSKKPPTYNPGFPTSCSFSTNKTFEGQLNPSKPFSYRRFSWLILCGCQVRNKKFYKKNKPFRVETDMVSNSERLLLLFFRFELFSPS